MSIPVPFGQYVPGDSAVHRLDARAKLGVTVAFSVALFAVDEWVGLGVIALVVLIAIMVAEVPIRLAARGLIPVSWLLLFTVAANALRMRPDAAVLMMGPVGVDGPGLARGGYFAVRVLVLVLGTSIITLTTSPVELTDALALLMAPFGRIGFPADDAAMMLSIALRFVPTTAEEAERIVVAQTARGARFDRGGVVRRARAWIPVLVPLFVRLFRRADDLAIAMESRAYRGVGRTRLRDPRMGTFDWSVLIACVAAAVAVAMAW